MRVKCLGRVSYPHEIQIITAVPRPDYHDQKPEREPYFSQYLELGSKQYSPISESGEIIKSKDLYEKFVKKSKREPQLIYEFSNKKPKKPTRGRLYLYKEKIYECDQNYYNQQQVKWLILDYLEKERKRFAQLRLKYKS